MEDISKYRTRYPPREHEEAVRMLLEGLDKQSYLSDATSEPRSSSRSRKIRSSKNGQVESQDEIKLNRQGESLTTGKMKIAKNSAVVVHHNQTHDGSSVDSGSLAQFSGDDDDDNEDERALRGNEFTRSVRNETRVGVEKDENLGFNSEESSSQDAIQVSPQIPTKRVHGFPNRKTNSNSNSNNNNNNIQSNVQSANNSYDAKSGARGAQKIEQIRLPKMHSKATSTASDSMSTSGASSTGRSNSDKQHNVQQLNDNDSNGNYESIPSRTIAIQCDLKLSSIKRDGYLDSASTDLASMQASSISSTRYGFYKLSPEILEQRRRLARSVSSRNISRTATDAPTSMSEMSSSSERDEDEDEDEIEDEDEDEDENEIGKSFQTNRFDREEVERAPDQSSYGDERAPLRRDKRDQRFHNQRRQTELQSSRRRDLLPQRPKTALSYVSTSKLRDQQESRTNDELAPDERSLSDCETPYLADVRQSEALRIVKKPRQQPTTTSIATKRITPKSRAMSQQHLLSTTATSQRVDEFNVQTTRGPGQLSARYETTSVSNSDNELNTADRFRVPLQDEIVVSPKRGRPVPGASPQVSRSNNIRNGPMFRRAANVQTNSLGSPNGHLSFRASTNLREQENELNNLTQTREPVQLSRGTNLTLTRKALATCQDKINANLSTDEEDQRLASDERRRRVAALIEHHQTANQLGKKSRFSSMSLSRQRATQQPVVDRIRGSCNLINGKRESALKLDDSINGQTDGSVYEPAGEFTRSHEDRSLKQVDSHQQGQRQQRPRSTTVRSEEDRIASRTNTGRAQIGRSTSMKASRPTTGPNVYTVPDCGQQQQQHTIHKQQRRHCARANECEYEENNCCAPGDEIECNGSLASGELVKRFDSDPDSESSPVTRTWANPGTSLARRSTQAATSTTTTKHNSHHESIYNLNNNDASSNEQTTSRRPLNNCNKNNLQATNDHLSRRNARSHSMRDINQQSHNENYNSLLNDNHTEATQLHRQKQRFGSVHRAATNQCHLENNDRDEEDEIPSEGFSICSTSSINNEQLQLNRRNNETMQARAHALHQQRQHQHEQLDFDSQQRLNEIGLPEPELSSSSAVSSIKRASASHLGLSSGACLSSMAGRYATTGRANSNTGNAFGQSHAQRFANSGIGAPTLITGRALSQQSLTRPTMPLSRRLRRSGAGDGRAASNGSGSDVGGSSMSLVSRLRDGSRYENAHIRSPVVMLIPQAIPSSNKHASDTSLSRSETNSRRASSCLTGRTVNSSGKVPGSRVSSQDRNRKSSSRNGSDSESSSSMLRTLVKPRVSRVASINRSARRRPVHSGGGGGFSNGRNDSDLEENMDGVGQLASEMDSYKFRRRYSVPKDAKINWFSKLKQRVTTSKS